MRGDPLHDVTVVLSTDGDVKLVDIVHMEVKYKAVVWSATTTVSSRSTRWWS